MGSLTPRKKGDLEVEAGVTKKDDMTIGPSLSCPANSAPPTTRPYTQSFIRQTLILLSRSRKYQSQIHFDIMTCTAKPQIQC